MIKWEEILWTLVGHTPSKYTRIRSLVNVGPPSQTVDQHWFNFGPVYRVCRHVSMDRKKHRPGPREISSSLSQRRQRPPNIRSLVNVGPPSQTVDQHWFNFGPVYRVCRHVSMDRKKHRPGPREISSSLSQRRQRPPNIQITLPVQSFYSRSIDRSIGVGTDCRCRIGNEPRWNKTPVSLRAPGGYHSWRQHWREGTGHADGRGARRYVWHTGAVLSLRSEGSRDAICTPGLGLLSGSAGCFFHALFTIIHVILSRASDPFTAKSGNSSLFK